MKIVFAVAILLMITGFNGCYEPTHLEGLPPQTMTGERTMGFRLNGEDFYNVVHDRVNAVLYAHGDQLEFGGHFNDGSSINVSLYVPDLSVVHYTIDNTTKINFAEYRTEYDECWYGIGDNTRFNSHPDNVVIIEFTRLDQEVASGTFTMKLKVTGCPDVEILEGRFDLAMVHA